MRKVKYRLSCTVDEITVKITDFLGKEYIITRCPKILKSRVFERCYSVSRWSPNYISEVALKDRIMVEDGIWVRAVKVELVDLKPVNIYLDVEFSYLCFKPKVEFNDYSDYGEEVRNLKIEEVK